MRSKRIAVIWPFGEADDAGLGQFYLRAFRELGHDAWGASLHTIDPWTPKGHLVRRPRTEPEYLMHRVKQLRAELRRRRIEIALVIKAEDLAPDHVRALRPSADVPLVLYHPDSPIWILRPYRAEIVEALREYDLVVTFAKLFVPVFRQMGVKAVARIPFAHDPAIHRPVHLHPADQVIYSSDLSYAGNTGPLQRYWMRALARFEPKAFGGGWDHPSRAQLAFRRVAGYRRYVSGLPGFGAKLTLVCAGAKVMLNLVRAETDCAHSMKTFELPACGATVVTNRTEEQLEFFPEGCAYFDTQQDAIELIESLLVDPGAREQLAQKGREEARPHTYVARAADLLNVVQP